MSESFVIDKDKIPGALLLTYRAGLKLEARGLKRGRRSVLSIVRNSAIDLYDAEGKIVETIDPITDKRTAKAAYADLNALIVRLLGEEFDNPLPADFERIF